MNQVPFKDLGLNTADFLNQLFKGCVPVEGGLHFLHDPAKGYHINYLPLHPAGGRINRLGVLSIEGLSRSDIISSDVMDWEVRGAETPYDNIQELLREYRLDFTSLNVSLEAVLPQLVEVDHASLVTAGVAKVGVIMSSDLPRERASIGYRVIVDQSVISRSRVHAADMSWSVADNHQRGVAEIQVPPAAIVHCVANFGDVAQYSYYVTDPENAPNDRRAAYESYDSELSLLREWLFRELTRGTNARDFEAAVSWLVWMLGFSPVLLGLFPKTQEAADVLVTSPRGNYAVVECTLGMLRSENKLATLVRRSNELKERLKRSGNANANVLPVIVTALPRESVAAELEQAEQLGVAVVTREVLEVAIEQTSLPLRPDAIYDDALRAVSEAASKHNR
ncbi:MAG: hypothetical protein KJ947_07010 [Alphaproteobacteria bacterium]|nr:hypothetical protein [Alphaproteobacteria bacterium]MBU1549311.1 hypothetical protein [Alphaproteobacteria bacterium]MBU2338360.1 hypothetical protein [Alphaproteobacteria bacterium]MBU2388570.1 hypothetical protein [Alphaproteobacteria bacterium]